MSTVQAILANKGGQVFTIGREASVLDAALLMNDHKIGALVVTQNQRCVGIFTERDMLTRVVSKRHDPAATHIHEVMTGEVACARPDTTIEEARTVMRNRRIRHLPVVDDEHQILGMVSIGDLNAWHLSGQEQTIYFLQEYLYGRV